MPIAEDHPEYEVNNETPPPPTHGEEEANMIPYKPNTYSKQEMIQRSKQFYENMNARRSVRYFSSKDVPLEVIENIVHTAGQRFFVEMFFKRWQ